MCTTSKTPVSQTASRIMETDIEGQAQDPIIVQQLAIGRNINLLISCVVIFQIFDVLSFASLSVERFPSNSS